MYSMYCMFSTVQLHLHVRSLLFSTCLFFWSLQDPGCSPRACSTVFFRILAVLYVLVLFQDPGCSPPALQSYLLDPGCSLRAGTGRRCAAACTSPCCSTFRILPVLHLLFYLQDHGCSLRAFLLYLQDPGCFLRVGSTFTILAILQSLRVVLPLGSWLFYTSYSNFRILAVIHMLFYLQGPGCSLRAGTGRRYISPCCSTFRTLLFSTCCSTFRVLDVLYVLVLVDAVSPHGVPVLVELNVSDVLALDT